MEVHNPHHPTHKKKWSEYIIEFIMLFTAVTLGFFAENIREGITEKHKKKELLEIVSQDFNKDINQLKFHADYANQKIKSCNLMIQFLDGDHSKLNQKEYYHNLKNIKGWWFFNPEEKSRIEAESKGYFYTKENSELADAILRFNFFKNDYKVTEGHEEKFIDKFNNQIPFISDFNIFYSINHYPDREAGNLLGVKNIKQEEIVKTKYIISEIVFFNDIYLDDIDSMRFYAKKATDIIQKQNN